MPSPPRLWLPRALLLALAVALVSGRHSATGDHLDAVDIRELCPLSLQSYQYINYDAI